MNSSNFLQLQAYNTFIFDFDYTLANSSKGILMCFHTVLRRHHFSGITDDMIKRTIGMTLEDSFAQLTGLGDKETLLNFKTEYKKEADMVMSANTHFYPEALSFLKRIREISINNKIGIVSTKESSTIGKTIDEYNVQGLFDIIIGIEEVRVAKPDPEGLLLAVSRLNSTTDKTLYFGDSIIDAKTAHSAGVDFVAVTTGATTKDELSSYPHKAILSSFASVIE
ncbi:HAD family hydrolase [Dysgonomonas sp. 520]|uniref:HAD family hydrolase n=1 Tax=Dysgonomonas sp. 520 TaxID=2302931 RepID=UPI0013D879CB|nr:HAD-IA family hydrolase [Dysgonomonas sp. 520]NDW10306.1 HAD family hydrolase [Dysgonomonas sp. 520]